MTITERHGYITRARRALEQLESNPAASRAQLGAARDQLNIVHNRHDLKAVKDALDALEQLAAGTDS